MNYVLIDTFYEKTFEYVKENKSARKKDIFEYLRSLGLSQVILSVYKVLNSNYIYMYIIK